MNINIDLVEKRKSIDETINYPIVNSGFTTRKPLAKNETRKKIQFGTKRNKMIYVHWES